MKMIILLAAFMIVPIPLMAQKDGTDKKAESGRKQGPLVSLEAGGSTKESKHKEAIRSRIESVLEGLGFRIAPSTSRKTKNKADLMMTFEVDCEVKRTSLACSVTITARETKPSRVVAAERVLSDPFTTAVPDQDVIAVWEATQKALTLLNDRLKNFVKRKTGR